MGQIAIRHLDKSYNDSTHIFQDFEVTIPDESFTVILGPSGCGKSTLLRIISGLEEIGGGDIYIGDKEMSEVAPKDRNIAMVFQNYALYPHMTVYDNIAYALKIKKMNKQAIDERVYNALEIVELTDQAQKRPAQLSGGQQQRVALARAIVKEPEAFLMDEPLSNLDAKLRVQMRDMLASLHQTLMTTMIFVTHDQAEAMSLADNIILLNKGEIMQQGSPRSLYQDPDNRFVARFIGSPPTNVWEFNDISIGIKPEDVQMDVPENLHSAIQLQGDIVNADPQGSEIVCTADTLVGKIHIKQANTWESIMGMRPIYLPKDKLLFFDINEQRIRDIELIQQYMNEFESYVHA